MFTEMYSHIVLQKTSCVCLSYIDKSEDKRVSVLLDLQSWEPTEVQTKGLKPDRAAAQPPHPQTKE
jgi:hypothetical protein